MKIKKTAKQKTKLVLSTLTAAAVAVPAIGLAGYYLVQNHDSHADSKASAIFTADKDKIGELSSPVAAIRVATPTRYTDTGAVQATVSFDDPNFFACVNDTYREMTGSDLPKDDKEMTEALASIEYLNCSNRQIKSVMPAFMDMRGLIEADLSYNEIWDFQMPVGYWQNLQVLNLAGNHLDEKTFNFQQNNNLTDLNLSNNQFGIIDSEAITWYTIQNLDVSGNKNLTDINLAAIKDLRSFNAAETSLDFAQKDYLQSARNLTELDLSNTHVVKFGANLPLLKKLNLSNTDLEVVGIELNPKLEELNVARNKLSELNLDTATNLTKLDASDNNLSSIQLSQSLNLEEIDVSGNNLTDINLSNLPNLRGLYAETNKLSSIDVSSLANLRELNVGQNQLTSADISHNPNLIMFANYENQISDVDLSQNAQLQQVGIWDNNIKTVDLSNNPEVELLVADNILVRTKVVINQIAGAKDFDLNSLKFIGVYAPGANQNKRSMLMTTFEPSEFYTWDAQNKSLSVNDLEGTQGYAQVIPDPNIDPRLAMYADHLKYRLQLTEGADPDVPVPHTDGGNTPAAPNTGFGSAATIVAAVSVAVPTLIASILATRAIRNRKRGHIKFD